MGETFATSKKRHQAQWKEYEQGQLIIRITNLEKSQVERLGELAQLAQSLVFTNERLSRLTDAVDRMLGILERRPND